MYGIKNTTVESRKPLLYLDLSSEEGVNHSGEGMPKSGNRLRQLGLPRGLFTR